MFLLLRGKNRRIKLATKESFTEKRYGRARSKELYPYQTDVDSEKIVAQLENGFLSISVPKREEAKPKQITINVQ